jgi:translation initiation factor 2-alpha kinase 4
MVAIDAPVEVFDAMARNDKWVENDEAWRTIAQGFPTQYSGYANQVREVVLRKKEDGVQFLLLFSVKEERMALINF